MENQFGFWSTVNRYPFGSFVLALSTIWAVEGIISAAITAISAESSKSPKNCVD